MYIAFYKKIVIITYNKKKKEKNYEKKIVIYHNPNTYNTIVLYVNINKRENKHKKHIRT